MTRIALLGILASKSRRAERGEDPIKEHLLLTRYCPTRVSRGDMLSVQDVQEILAIKLLGVTPESQVVLRASNSGSGHSGQGVRCRSGLLRTPSRACWAIPRIFVFWKKRRRGF